VRAQARAGELAFGPDHDVGDLLQFPAPPLLPLGHGAPQPGLGGAHLGGAHLGGGHLGGGHLGGGGHLCGPAGGHAGLDAGGGGGLPHALEVKSEGMDAMLEMFLRVRRPRVWRRVRVRVRLGLSTEARVCADRCGRVPSSAQGAASVCGGAARAPAAACTLECARALRGSPGERGAVGSLGQSARCCQWHGEEVNLAGLLLAACGQARSAQAVAHRRAPHGALQQAVRVMRKLCWSEARARPLSDVGRPLRRNERARVRRQRSPAAGRAWMRCVQPGRLGT